MDYHSINFRDKLSKISEHWSPRIIAQMNDYHFKVVKVQGEFIWHDHPETDEVFVVLKGQLEMNEGEMFVVPKGLEHKPVAKQECHMLLVEPAGTVNTGNIVNERTTAKDVWI